MLLAYCQQRGNSCYYANIPKKKGYFKLKYPVMLNLFQHLFSHFLNSEKNK